MSCKHLLSIQIPNNTHPGILRIEDTSVYCDDLEVNCGKLEIFIPGFCDPVTIDVVKNFGITITACMLGLQMDGCNNDLADIPDGIYTIKYSVSPNDKVCAVYEYLRTTSLTNEYMVSVAIVKLLPCAPSVEVETRMRDLNLIKNYIEVSKAMVEYKGHAREGLELFTYAQKLLWKFNGIAC